ncbi:MAG: ATP-dependent DNA helicase RecQ [Deltaproteobacteria bacterium ADurb.Bin135]|nr:MAG: ATP-dependent DNA helicase RecQ [Deltaproteobacteria bacterium ADurb.Bin135]
MGATGTGVVLAKAKGVRDMAIEKFLQENGWSVVYELTIPPRDASLSGFDDLGLSMTTFQTLQKMYPRGIYSHQKNALKSILTGDNVCLTTGTASGKSLVFYATALEHLVRNPTARIIAMYPLKALGKEQEERWVQFMRTAGLKVNIGRIDGQVPMMSRLPLIKNSQILVVTPDIIHAWFTYSLNEKAIAKFLAETTLIIVDEAHNYTGVFGSNSAFLFRRMQHVMSLMNASCQYISASATIANPEKHLANLFGLDFTLIGPEADTSPRREVRVKFLNPPAVGDLLTSLPKLMEFITRETDDRFIAFVDSRKQTEYITTIAARSVTYEDNEEDILINNLIEKLQVLPYRAGYEEHDRRAIQERLTNGTLTGVVSTSALELGIDIPSLTLGILIGVPRSSTSFYQRIGRIGRHRNGVVLIINTGDMFNENIFADPKQLLKMPLSESALYLENPRIQYIHALCLARMDGEHDRVSGLLRVPKSTEFKSNIAWPKGFIDLCNAERAGVISTEFQNMKAQAGDDPNHTYPLRDVELQFQVKRKKGPTEESRGSLSYGQLMREAYPGAVYYYATRPYRVYRVSTHKRLVEVREEKKYTTKPQMMPTLVFPNLAAGNVFSCKRHGDVAIAECNLQIREAILGFKERRGPNENSYVYPLDQSGGIFFDQPRFTRNFFTTGVVLSHPALNLPNVKTETLANLLYEVFLMVIPFERRDIQFAADKHRIQQGPFAVDDKFLCVYDQTYGSLRLSGRIMEEDIISQVVLKLEALLEIAKEDGTLEKNSMTAKAMDGIVESLSATGTEYPLGEATGLPIGGPNLVKVLKPGTKGLDVTKDNEEFFIEKVFYSPTMQGIAYRGKHISENNARHDDVLISVPAKSLVEIPGESEFCLYDLESGEIKDM